MFTTLDVKTSKPIELIDLTSQVQTLIDQNKIEKGVCFLFVPHTTAGLTINENTDPDVVRDILFTLDKLVPLEDGYKHWEGNSSAHIKATLFGSSETVIVDRGKLVLGQWQGIYFCEFDGPRNRKLQVKLIVG